MQNQWGLKLNRRGSLFRFSRHFNLMQLRPGVLSQVSAMLTETFFVFCNFKSNQISFNKTMLEATFFEGEERRGGRRSPSIFRRRQERHVSQGLPCWQMARRCMTHGSWLWFHLGWEELSKLKMHMWKPLHQVIGSKVTGETPVNQENRHIFGISSTALDNFLTVAKKIVNWIKLQKFNCRFENIREYLSGFPYLPFKEQNLAMENNNTSSVTPPPIPHGFNT